MDPNYPLQPGGYPPQQPYVAASQVKKSHSIGLLITLAVFGLLTLAFGVLWFMNFSKYNDLKNNFDQKLAVATEEARKEISAQKDAELAEKEKSPYETYQGPTVFGSIKITYPKTWSAFVTEDERSSTPVDGYFHPGFVPGMNSGTAFALRLEVTETNYDQLLRKYEGDSKAGKVKVTPYQINGTAGVRVDGEIDNTKKGSVVMFSLRDKTVRLTAESEQFTKDFNEVILKNLTFVP